MVWFLRRLVVVRQPFLNDINIITDSSWRNAQFYRGWNWGWSKVPPCAGGLGAGGLGLDASGFDLLSGTAQNRSRLVDGSAAPVASLREQTRFATLSILEIDYGASFKLRCHILWITNLVIPLASSSPSRYPNCGFGRIERLSTLVSAPIRFANPHRAQTSDKRL